MKTFTAKEVEMLEAGAKSSAERAREARKTLQDQCAHPLANLSFQGGATSSHTAGYDEYSMRVECALCGGYFPRKLRIDRGL